MSFMTFFLVTGIETNASLDTPNMPKEIKKKRSEILASKLGSSIDNKKRVMMTVL